MKKISFYEEAHIFVAAARLFEFKMSKSAGYSDICDLTGMHNDRVSYIAMKLRDAGVIDIVEGAFSQSVFNIKDYLKIEEFPKEVHKNKMADEINKFKTSSKSKLEEKVKAFTSEKKKKDKQLFDEIQNRFKKELGKNK